MYRGPSAPRMKLCKSVPCFRIVSSSIHRDALRACAVHPNRAALCVYRAARCGERIERRRWRMKRDERVAAVKILSVRRKTAQKFWAPQQGHRALRSSIGKPSVGADAYIGPLTALLVTCHCETSSQTGVAIRILGPLPKGGCHGEVVTGGFFSRTHGRAHGPCPTRCCVIGPGRTESSAPTSISVGATLAVARGRGRAPPLRTPRKPPHPMQNPMSLRGQCAHWPWQSVTPSPRPPCLKSAL